MFSRESFNRFNNTVVTLRDLLTLSQLCAKKKIYANSLIATTDNREISSGSFNFNWHERTKREREREREMTTSSSFFLFSLLFAGDIIDKYISDFFTLRRRDNNDNIRYRI